MKRGTRTPQLVSVVWVLLLLLITLAPFAWLLAQSFKTSFDAVAVPPKFLFRPILGNYLAVLGQAGFLAAFRDSLIIAAGSVTLTLLLGVPFAYALARFEFRGKGDIAFFILSTRMLPAIVVIVPFIQIFNLLHLNDSYLGLTLAHILVNLALVVWVMRGFFQGIPKELEEAALIDGCTLWGSFWRIVLPLARPGLASVASLGFLFSWNELLFAFTLTSFNVKTLPVFMATQYVGFLAVDWGKLSAAGVLATLPIIVLVLVMQRNLVAGLTLGAVK